MAAQAFSAKLLMGKSEIAVNGGRGDFGFFDGMLS
jgi:hypothetical protein